MFPLLPLFAALTSVVLTYGAGEIIELEASNWDEIMVKGKPAFIDL